MNNQDKHTLTQPTQPTKPTQPTQPTQPTKLNKKKIEYITTDRRPCPVDQRRASCTTPEYERILYREQECCTSCTLQ